MPLAAEDAARLPPMVPYAEVEEKRRLEELREFRRYLADSGAVRCLVDLYKHTKKNEMRLDNPRLVKQFMQSYKDASPEAEEAQQLERENDTLREYNAVLEDQARELADQIEKQQMVQLARALWSGLAAEEFWAGTARQLTFAQLGHRLCSLPLVAQGALASGEEGEPLTQQGMVQWIAGMPEDLLGWCREELLPRLQDQGRPDPESPLFEPDDLGVQVFLGSAARLLLPEGAGGAGAADVLQPEGQGVQDS